MINRKHCIGHRMNFNWFHFIFMLWMLIITYSAVVKDEHTEDTGNPVFLCIPGEAK